MKFLITENELMKLLKISRTTLYFMRKRGMPYVVIGTRSIRYVFDDVMFWLNNNNSEIGAYGGTK